MYSMFNGDKYCGEKSGSVFETRSSGGYSHFV